MIIDGKIISLKDCTQMIAMDISRYNPDGSALRRDQLELLKMLKVLSGICKENGIRWWLCSGTLLGAVRHDGFIPWDDDVDIAMLPEDYAKLEKVLADNNEGEYVLHSMKTDPEYIYVFGKFRARSGEYDVKDPRYKYYKWKGMSIDIFTMEKTNYVAAQSARFFYKIGHKVSTPIRNQKLRLTLTRFVNFFNFRILFPFFRWCGKINPKGEYHYVLGTGFARSTFHIEDIFPLGNVSFEGETFPAPHDADSYLTGLYGDWRKLPSEAQIKKAIHCKEYREEIFGKENQ